MLGASVLSAITPKLPPTCGVEHFPHLGLFFQLGLVALLTYRDIIPGKAVTYLVGKDDAQSAGDQGKTLVWLESSSWSLQRL